MSTHYRKLYPSNYIGEFDLEGKEHKVIIESIQRVGVFVPQSNREEEKVVVTFTGRKKAWICNRTNADRIAQIHGEDADLWVGKEITLMPAKTKVGGKLVPCVRVKPEGESKLKEEK